MSYMPVYWKTSLYDVEETMHLVKKGKVTMAAKSAGGRPIYTVEYGTSNLPERKANLSSAMGGKDINCYADKTGADYVPTVFIVGCVHGGEFEGTSAVLNLIKMIETGTDYAGNTNAELLAWAEKTHLILIPIVNPDGRARVPFHSFVDRTFYELRYYDQGTWKDGSLCNWPDCKKVHPIKDYVDYLGAYFNDDGVNMMHENFFGEVSTGTRLVLDICDREAPDYSILLHGGSNSVNHMIAPTYASQNAKNEVYELEQAIFAVCEKEQVRYKVLGLSNSEKNANSPSFNLPSAMHHCCGTPAVTFESNQGLSEYVTPTSIICDYEEIYKMHMILFSETMRYYLKKFGKI